ncbi:MAG: queuosine precursor transporter [Holosporales bacterium]|nr:queuosine precursor transporter [Holosporales bacterium]
MQKVIQAGNSFYPEWLSIIELCVALTFLKILHKFAGIVGLHTYNAIVVCIANIEVLHVTKYELLSTPVPLGTILFTTTFIANNIIADKYGNSYARKSVYLSFLVYTFFSISLIISIMHNPFVDESVFLQQAFLNHESMMRLFVPSLRILVASLVAFLCGQLFNISVFRKIRCIKTPWFSLLEYLGIFLAGLLDNIVFSSIAFYFLASPALSLSLLLNGYIIPSCIIRFIIILLCMTMFKMR